MIFYFSATGNTRWAAQRVAEATQERLVSIAEALSDDCRFELSPTERIGFAFPVHGWRPPLPVRRFVEHLSVRLTTEHELDDEDLKGEWLMRSLLAREETRARFCYALITAGDDIGETTEWLDRAIAANPLLHRLGIYRLHSAFSLVMPNTYVGLPGMTIDAPAKVAEKKKRAAELLEEYLPLIVERQKGERRLHLSRWPRTNSRLLGGLFERFLLTDGPFRVDRERCIQCGICAEVCPTENVIGGRKRYPQWKHDGSCITCFACYHHCPQRAIDYGSRTRGKGQYAYQGHKPY